MQNIVFIIEDEKRTPPPYEQNDHKLMELRRNILRGDEFLKQHGISFNNHMTPSTACTPARASIILGQPMHVHGIDQTEFNKMPSDPRLKWLQTIQGLNSLLVHNNEEKVKNLKTLGHVMRENGYDCLYVGKWHLSEDSLDLEQYGFSGWFGPEPHGPDLNNSGKVRDPIYIDAAIQMIKNRIDSKITKPFLLVISLVNPHDIVLYSKLYLLMKTTNTFNHQFTDPPLPQDISTVAKLFSKKYESLMLPVWLHKLVHNDRNALRNYYLDMEYEADKQKFRFLEFFSKTEFYNNTYIIATSDHGDMLFAKDNLQKFYVPYREAIHIPLIIHHPAIKSNIQYNGLTSGLDIFPTILGLCEIDKNCKKLYGVDLSYIVNNAINNIATDIDYNRTIIFETNDDLYEGETAYPLYYNTFPFLKSVFKSVLGMNDPINCPKYIQSIITYINGKMFKLNKYYVANFEEWELFNLDDDPCETINIYTKCDKLILNELKIRFINTYNE